MKNRGRFQAQGIKLEESESWSQMSSLISEDAINLINKLEIKLPTKDKKIRKKVFEKTRTFVLKAKKNGGISVIGLNLFSKTYLVMGSERVDIEIHKGIAFI